MRPYIQAKGNMPGNIKYYTAYMGFKEMGVPSRFLRTFRQPN